MAKPRPNRLGMYADVSNILDAALAHGGGSYALESNGAAVHWRQRAYAFRKLYAETIGGMSKYDRLTFPRIVDGSSVVQIRLVEAKGLFTPASEIATLGADEPFDDDDLLEYAKKFAENLKKED